MIDWNARKLKEDKVVAALGALDEFERWTAYEKLYNEGKRIVEAPRRIDELSPRLPSGKL